MVNGRAPAELSIRAARLSDRLLDLAVLAFGAWTVVYHACLVLGLGILAAGVGAVAGLLASGLLAFRRVALERAPEAPAPETGSPAGRKLVLAYGLAALAAAAVYAFSSGPWGAVWLVLFATAAAGTVLAFRRASLGPGEGEDGPGGAGALAALGWAAGLAVLSLFLVRSDSDDTQYVRLSTWVAERGEFPLRDFLFSDGVFPAIFYPPLSSFEALAGLVARGTGVSAPAFVYLVVPPVASALSVLATWRLLRAWRVRLIGLALSTALVFLLMAGQEHRTLGSLFVGRIWQGKIVFLAVLVPLLFALLLEYARRPTRRRLLLLAAAGAAGVGLTSTGAFLVPILAAGCLAPLALRARRDALAGFAALTAYPVGALLATAALGGRRAGEDVASDVAAGELARVVLGDGLFAFVAVGAALLGPLVLGSRRGALMAAGTVLLVVAVYAPGLPSLVWELTGIGRVLWRVVWIVPVAALAGAVATAVPARLLPRPLAPVPAVLLCAVLVAWGAPVWETGTVASSPSWKRDATVLGQARRILAGAEPGAVVLAPSRLSETLVILSSDVTAVVPRPFYTASLDAPGAHVEERLRLQSMIDGRSPPATAELARGLRVVGVDLACAPKARHEALEALAAAGYVPAFDAGRLTCLRPSA